MTHKPIDILHRETVFQGYFRVDRYRLRHGLHKGGMGAPILREVFERGHAAAVLLLDPLRWEVVLLEQFRIGAHAAGLADAWLTEIVAGIIHDGESAEEVARREAREETGLDVEALWPIAEYIVSPGGASETVSLFLGRVDARDCEGIHGLDEEHEDIRVFAMPVDEAISLLDSGKANNALMLIALQWLALNKEEVRRRWTGQD